MTMVGSTPARAWEDFAVGQEWLTVGRTVTEADVVNFAGLSGDFNQIHVDAEYSRIGPFGERVAHGLLVLAIASGLWTRLGLSDGCLIAFLGIKDWKFGAPVRLGDTIRVRTSVAETRPTSRPGRGIVTFETTVVNQRDEVVQQGQRVLMLARRSGGGGG